MVSARAVVVGVTNADSTRLAPLPGAQHDAFNMKRILVRAGLGDESVTALVGDHATRQNVLRALASGRADRLIFYFAGHGLRLEEPGIPVQSLLLTMGAEVSAPQVLGVSLKEIADTVARTRPSQVFVFVDACGVESYPLIEALAESARLTALEVPTLMCVTAAPKALAREAEGSRGGVFSEHLCATLLREDLETSYAVAQQLVPTAPTDAFPRPSILMVGDCSAHPLRGVARRPLVVGSRATVYRQLAVDEIASVLHMSTTRRIWMTAESGMGKTELLQQVVALDRSVGYTSCPVSELLLNMEPQEVMTHIGATLAAALPEVFPSGMPPGERLEGSLTQVERRGHHRWLIVDHVDRLNGRQLRALRGALDTTRMGALLVSQRESPPSDEWEVMQCPPINREEAAEIVGMYGSPEQRQLSDAYLLASHGNALRLRSLVALQELDPVRLLLDSATDGERRAMSSILTAGAYMDRPLFCDQFGILIEDLDRVASFGLAYFDGEVFQAHDGLRAFSESLTVSEVEGVTYWDAQLRATPTVVSAAQLFAAKCIESGGLGASTEAITICTQLLARVKDWPKLRGMADALATNPQVSSLSKLVLAERLVRRADIDSVDRLLRSIEFAELDELNQAFWRLIASERAWWFGEFQYAVTEARGVADVAAVYSPELWSRAQLNIGIAEWFLGEWDASVSSLLNAETSAESSPRTAAWASLMLATNLGQRGLDIDKAKERFLRSIQVLEELGDSQAVAIAWGNLGEMTWKLEDLPTARTQLTEGIKVAEHVCSSQQILEIRRNMLQVLLRALGPWSTELSNELDQCERLYRPALGPQSRMQYLNTICTIEIMRGHVERARELLVDLHPLTKGNLEYSTYTWGNEVLYRALVFQEQGVRDAYGQLAGIMMSAGNPLARRQMLWDRSLLQAYQPAAAAFLLEMTADLEEDS